MTKLEKFLIITLEEIKSELEETWDYDGEKWFFDDQLARKTTTDLPKKIETIVDTINLGMNDGK